VLGVEWTKFLQDRKGQAWNVVSARRESLAPFIEALKAIELPRRHNIFPTNYEIYDFNVLKAYIEDSNSKELTKSLWLKLLPSILTELDCYCNNLRIEAIRAILAAQQGISITKISSSPVNYPESSYPDTFFDLATSHFPPYWDNRADGVQHYSQVGLDRYWSGKSSFSRLFERRTTLTIQSIVEAAGLDHGEATAEDLNELGRRFTWDNDPTIGRRDNLRTWKELVRRSV
jgi:hypothetical protein